MLRRIYEDSNLASLHAVIKEEASFKGIAIRITGTNGATATTLRDIGRMYYIKNGETIIDADFDFLLALNHIFGGNPYDNSTGSGALEFFTYIPRRFKDMNVDHVLPSDNAQLKCTFGANLATRVASGGKVEVYLDIEQGVQKYDLSFKQYSDSISGAGTRPLALEQPNIIGVGLSAVVSSVLTLTGSNISQLAVNVGDSDYGDFSLGAMQNITNAMMNLESDYAIAALPFLAEGDITSRLNDNVRLSITTSGASAPEIMVMSALFDYDRMRKTATAQQNRINRIMLNKQQRRMLETYQTIKTLAGNAVK